MTAAILMVAATLNFFLPSQQAWIVDETRTAIAEKSRRIGFTYAEAYRSVERRIKLGTDHIFASRTKATAGEFLEYCRLFADVFGVVAEDMGEQPIARDGDVKAHTIRFRHPKDPKRPGGRIMALSSNPDAFRGYGGDVTLDEFAFHKKQRLVLKAANASAKIWGHTVRIISTHNGEGTLFNRLIQEYRAGKRDPAKWSLHSVTLQQAVDEGLVGKVRGEAADTPEARKEFIADIRNDCVDDTEWMEEYCCVPNTDATAFLNYELIDAAREPGMKLIEDPADLTGIVYAGYDVSRRRDLCVLWACELVGDVYWTRLLRVLEGEERKFSNQEALLHRLYGNRHVRRGCIDQTGMGEMLAEYMADRWRSRAEGVILSGPRKSAIAAPFKGLFEDRRIRIPDDDDLREDLHKTRKVVTAGGNVRLSAESDDAGHADRFWAGALMREAADQISTSGVVRETRREKPAWA
jgi:phage FluMu gp28-like protein